MVVFIIGPARSGTSITYYAMREICRLPGRGESHVFPILYRIVEQFRTYQATFEKNHANALASSLDPERFRWQILEHARDFYGSEYPDGHWVDKTPGAEAILAAPLVFDAFPSAKLICTRRSGIEVVQSFKAKFAAGFQDACSAWARSMRALLTVRQSCINILEIDQHDIANSPAAIAQLIAKHLELPQIEVALTRFFATRRTDQLSAHDWESRLTMHRAGWNNSECAFFQETCGDLMDQFGYPL